MIASPLHAAQMVGTVEAPALSPEPLSVSDGVFNLFVENPDDVNTKNMKYRMVLTSQSGDRFYFEGFKVIRNDPGLDLWPDTTTLYITVYEGTQNTGAVVGKGILIIRPEDFARQMTTMKVLDASGPVERLKYQLKFGKVFAGALFETYGGILSPPKYFNPDAPPRKVRPLRVSTQEIYWVETADHVHIRLTRYQGGSKGRSFSRTDWACRARFSRWTLSKQMHSSFSSSADTMSGYWISAPASTYRLRKRSSAPTTSPNTISRRPSTKCSS